MPVAHVKIDVVVAVEQLFTLHVLESERLYHAYVNCRLPYKLPPEQIRFQAA